MFSLPDSVFQDRAEAGRKLAERLRHLKGSKALVVGLPRGGVVVAAEIARTLELDLEVLIVRKIGHPENPELGVGALVEGGTPRLDSKILKTLGLSARELEPTIEAERQEAERRARLYRGGRPFPDIRGRTVVLVDDGIATGNTVRAAVSALKTRGALRIILAVGVAPPETLHDLHWSVDEVVCLSAPQDFAAVGQAYRRFDQVEDEEVLKLLASTRRPTGAAGEGR